MSVSTEAIPGTKKPAHPEFETPKMVYLAAASAGIPLEWLSGDRMAQDQPWGKQRILKEREMVAAMNITPGTVPDLGSKKVGEGGAEDVVLELKEIHASLDTLPDRIFRAFNPPKIETAVKPERMKGGNGRKAAGVVSVLSGVGIGLYSVFGVPNLVLLAGALTMVALGGVLLAGRGKPPMIPVEEPPAEASDEVEELTQ